MCVFVCVFSVPEEPALGLMVRSLFVYASLKVVIKCCLSSGGIRIV